VEGSDQHFALAIDIGGSKVAYALIDIKGELLGGIEKLAVPFDDRGVASQEELIAQMGRFVERAWQRPGIFDGIGIGLCGNVDLQTGTVILAPNLHWRHAPMMNLVAQSYRVPVAISMDVRLAALGEAVWGGAKGVRNFAWVTVGTGYGGYFFLDGKLYDGRHAFAGNFGHIPVDEVAGYPCGCGLRGCIETYVSGPAIARAAQAAIAANRSPTLARLAGDGKATCEMVFQAEAAGDPVAVEIIEQVIRMVAKSVAGLVNTLDLEMIVFGGGVTKGSRDFVFRLDQAIRSLLMTEEARRELVIIQESYPNSTLFGAAANVFISQGLLEFYCV
jgi:glucokinase-like ROK family protein